jgi:hypothetical protein
VVEINLFGIMHNVAAGNKTSNVDFLAQKRQVPLARIDVSDVGKCCVKYISMFLD